MNGGGLKIVDGQANIENCSFSNLTSLKGGAIHFECKVNCSLSILGNAFSYCKAKEKGGAINYEWNRPYML